MKKIHLLRKNGALRSAARGKSAALVRKGEELLGKFCDGVIARQTGKTVTATNLMHTGLVWSSADKVIFPSVRKLLKRLNIN